EPMLDPESQHTPFKRDPAREKWFHAPSPQVVAQSQISRAKRQAAFTQVRELHQQGLSIRTIARSLGLRGQRVRRYLFCLTPPAPPVRSGNWACGPVLGEHRTRAGGATGERRAENSMPPVQRSDIR